MKIFIDGDGCPVIDITIKVAEENNVGCVLITDTSHIFDKYNIEVVTVSKGADSVDFALVNMIKSGDIVVTQDYGLAAMCLARKAIPINQNGMVYTNENIDSLLFTRHISKKIRMSGGRIKGPSKRGKENDEIFEKELKKLIALNFKKIY